MRYFSDFITQLHERLQQPLPDSSLRATMVPYPRPSLQSEIGLRKAGVLLLLYPHADTIFTALMRRTSTSKDTHSGQISLPGGKHETEDLNIEATALRETEEEFGIDRRQIRLLGSLTPVYIPVSHSLAYPAIGAMAHRPTFLPNSREVAEVIEVSLPHLQRPDIVKQTQLEIRGTSLRVPYYDVNGHIVWGATAIILSEFLSLVPS